MFGAERARVSQIHAMRSVKNGASTSTSAVPEPMNIANADAYISVKYNSEQMDINISRNYAMQGY